ncbi:mitochondrial matrix Mmp37-domain-containing protein [Coniochaeta sp. 2T2.1]|nr:mitochondrial matrix Mmp37-domain-containing protein [Coniochaeta sp. 2T2.1]
MASLRVPLAARLSQRAPPNSATDSATEAASRDSRSSSSIASEASGSSLEPDDWEANPNFHISSFKELPHANFGVNQHILINAEFKEVLRQVLWQFRAPIRYAFAYGSGVFPQTKSSGRIPTDAELRAIHPKAPAALQRAQDGTPKMIDFIFGVTFTQHWHSLNLSQHRDHYSFLGSLGSGAVSAVQDKWGAGVYFNPYVVINGILVKYGVVNLDTLERDLREWDTLYLAGRLQKPVKILRDDARIRLANQINLLSALRTALLLLPPQFTERELYNTIAGISYLGDPRMAFPTENPQKVANIVGNNLPHFRRLYAPLVETLPNVEFDDPGCRTEGWMSMDNDANLRLRQDMDPVKRGNMVRRLPKSFRSKLYFQYQKKFAIPTNEFDKMMAESRSEDTTQFRKRQGGAFEQRIAQDEPGQLRTHVRQVIKQTVGWPSTTQSLKSALTAGLPRMIRYLREKFEKSRQGKKQAKDATTGDAAKKTDKTTAETKASKSEKTS